MCVSRPSVSTHIMKFLSRYFSSSLIVVYRDGVTDIWVRLPCSWVTVVPGVAWQRGCSLDPDRRSWPRSCLSSQQEPVYREHQDFQESGCEDPVPQENTGGVWPLALHIDDPPSNSPITILFFFCPFKKNIWAKTCFISFLTVSVAACSSILFLFRNFHSDILSLCVWSMRKW